MHLMKIVAYRDHVFLTFDNSYDYKIEREHYPFWDLST